MADLTPRMVEVLEAVDRSEVELTRWPLWTRGVRWAGHPSPSLTVLGLRRRLLVDASEPDDTGRRWAVLTDDGREELKEVRRARADA